MDGRNTKLGQIVASVLAVALAVVLSTAGIDGTSQVAYSLEAPAVQPEEVSYSHAFPYEGQVKGASALRLPFSDRGMMAGSTTSTLQYSTFFGGGNSDDKVDLAVDDEGNVYIAGTTSSPDLPTTPGAYDRWYNGNTDVFLAKLSADGSTLLYSTYLGGSGEEMGLAIAVDDEGNVYITGLTYSVDFPATPGALDTTLDGGRDAFVAKLNAAGDELLYATYLGGISWDYGFCIAIDDAGSAFVGGFTHGSFPVTPGAAQTTFGGFGDGFVAKLSPDGSAMVYGTYLGGSSWEGIEGITVDAAGNAYVATHTHSPDFPTTPGAYDRVCDNCATNVSTDAAAAKLSANGSEFLYSTLVGGADPYCGEAFRDVVVDSDGNAYLTGESCSVDYPTTPGALQGTFGGGEADAIVTKVNADGSDLLYSTYLGGTGRDSGGGIAIDAMGKAYVAGATDSIDFPTAFPLQSTNAGGKDTFIAQLAQDASILLYGTYFGGGGDEVGDQKWVGFACAKHDIYLASATSSIDLPTTPAAYDVSFNGGAYDAFVAHLYKNDTPTAMADTLTVAEDSPHNVLDVLANDTDPDLDLLTVWEVGTPNQGGVAISAGTHITYTPAPEFFGTETFTYTISDGLAISPGAMVTVTVTPVCDYALQLEPPAAAQMGGAGTTVTYTLHVTNSGECVDVLDVSTDALWPTQVPATVGPLAVGQGMDVVVTVTIPAEACGGDKDVAMVTFASQGDSAISAAGVLTTTANVPIYRIYLPLATQNY
jgi:hypothetical protein